MSGKIKQKVPGSMKINLLILAMGRAVSNLGTEMFSFALSLYVLDITGSAGAFSLVFGLGIWASVLVNIFGSSFVDKWDRKKIMVISDLVSGIAVLGFLSIFIAMPKSIGLIIAYTVILNSLQTFLDLSITASVPNIVGEEHIAKANSAFQSIKTLIHIVAPLVGALAYKMLGMEMVFLINGISFIIAGIGEIFLKFERNRTSEGIGKEGNYIDNFRVIFGYIKEQRVIGFFLLTAVVMNFIHAPMASVGLRYINYDIQHVSEYQLSFILIGASIGSILGSIIVSIQKSMKKLLSKLFILLQIQALLIIAWIFPVLPAFKSDSKWLITIVFFSIMLVKQVIDSIQTIPIFSYFQAKVPENLRGRFFGIVNTSLMITIPIGTFLIGWGFDKFNWVYVVILAGVLMFALSVYFSRHRYFRMFIGELNSEMESGKKESEANEVLETDVI